MSSCVLVVYPATLLSKGVPYSNRVGLWSAVAQTPFQPFYSGQEGGLVDLPGVAAVQCHQELVEVIKVNDPLIFADRGNAI